MGDSQTATTKLAPGHPTRPDAGLSVLHYRVHSDRAPLAVWCLAAQLTPCFLTHVSVGTTSSSQQSCCIFARDFKGQLLLCHQATTLDPDISASLNSSYSVHNSALQQSEVAIVAPASPWQPEAALLQLLPHSRQYSPCLAASQKSGPHHSCPAAGAPEGAPPHQPPPTPHCRATGCCSERRCTWAASAAAQLGTSRLQCSR